MRLRHSREKEAWGISHSPKERKSGDEGVVFTGIENMEVLLDAYYYMHRHRCTGRYIGNRHRYHTDQKHVTLAVDGNRREKHRHRQRKHKSQISCLAKFEYLILPGTGFEVISVRCAFNNNNNNDFIDPFTSNR